MKQPRFLIETPTFVATRSPPPTQTNKLDEWMNWWSINYQIIYSSLWSLLFANTPKTIEPKTHSFKMSNAQSFCKYIYFSFNFVPFPCKPLYQRFEISMQQALSTLLQTLPSKKRSAFSVSSIFPFPFLLSVWWFYIIVKEILFKFIWF